MTSNPGENNLNEIQSRLLKERIIFLGSAIDDDISKTITDQLLLLESQDRNKDIQLFINSPGGSIDAGLAIYAVMQQIEPDIVTVCAGLATGMAAILLSAGTKGKRMALNEARIMMNRPEGGKQIMHLDDLTSATWQQRQNLEIGRYRQNLTEILAFHTGQPLLKIYQDTETDRFLSPSEAVHYGIIDRVIAR